jgi:hypothetical protein
LFSLVHRVRQRRRTSADRRLGLPRTGCPCEEIHAWRRASSCCFYYEFIDTVACDVRVELERMGLVLLGILLTFLLTPLVFKQPLQPWVEGLYRRPLRRWKRLRSTRRPKPLAAPRPPRLIIEPEPHDGLATMASVDANRRNTAHLRQQAPQLPEPPHPAVPQFLTTNTSSVQLAEDHARRRRNLGSGNFPGIDPAAFGPDPSMHRNTALLDLQCGRVLTDGSMESGAWD